MNCTNACMTKVNSMPHFLADTFTPRKIFTLNGAIHSTRRSTVFYVDIRPCHLMPTLHHHYLRWSRVFLWVSGRLIHSVWKILGKKPTLPDSFLGGQSCAFFFFATRKVLLRPFGGGFQEMCDKPPSNEDQHTDSDNA